MSDESAPVMSLKPGDLVTYKRKVGYVLTLGGMGFVRVQWRGQSRTSEVQASILRKVDGP